MKAIAWIGLCCGPWLMAPSAVYRCEVGGQVTYTDHACAAGTAPAELPALGTMPAAKGADLAKQFDERTKREREAHEKSERAWLEAHAKEKEAEDKAELTRQAARAARREAQRAGYTIRTPSRSEDAQRR
jgi:hypothetical protein